MYFSNKSYARLEKGNCQILILFIFGSISILNIEKEKSISDFIHGPLNLNTYLAKDRPCVILITIDRAVICVK